MTAEARTVVVAGNWKMHLRRPDVEEYCRRLRAEASNLPPLDVILFPPYTLLPVVAEELENTGILWGGQDLHSQDKGPHTGDVSALHLLDWGATWVLCGHSERRSHHQESPQLVGQKVAAARRNGLRPMLCVGETEGEREKGRTEEVLTAQLEAALPIDDSSWALAYEPVWAIGTGRTATPETAQEAQCFLRRRVGELTDEETARRLPILYGGSVKPDNCEVLLAGDDVDGFLIGGASLDAGSFLDIIDRCGPEYHAARS